MKFALCLQDCFIDINGLLYPNDWRAILQHKHGVGGEATWFLPGSPLCNLDHDPDGGKGWKELALLLFPEDFCVPDLSCFFFLLLSALLPSCLSRAVHFMNLPKEFWECTYNIWELKRWDPSPKPAQPQEPQGCMDLESDHLWSNIQRFRMKSSQIWKDLSMKTPGRRTNMCRCLWDMNDYYISSSCYCLNIRSSRESLQILDPISSPGQL